MDYLKWIWETIKSNVLLIALAIAFAIYIWANYAVEKQKAQVSENEFMCETTCFPAQHEYIYAGKVGSCWCYENKDSLKRIKSEG